MKKVQEFIKTFGAPERLVTDRGTCFTSNTFQNFSLQHGIKHTLNSSRHPQSNGLIQRLNSTIISIMKITTQNVNTNDWDLHLKKD